MKQEEIKDFLDKLGDKVEGLALLARQSGTPSHVLIEIRNEVKQLSVDLGEIKTQVIKTNGRVTNLERWKLILSTAIAVIIITKFPHVLGLLSIF